MTFAFMTGSCHNHLKPKFYGVQHTFYLFKIVSTTVRSQSMRLRCILNHVIYLL